MKLRILGCGTSSGVPRIGNDWGDCDPAEPRNRRTRSSALLESGGKRLLIDCGPDLREQLLAAEVAELDAVIVTHDHADHCHGIDELRQVFYHVGHPLPTFARANTLDRLRKRFAYAFEGTSLYPAVLHPMVVDSDLAFGDVTLSFAEQPHGGITSLGIRAKDGDIAIGYAIDFHAMTDAMQALYAKVDLWVCDCLRRTPHPTHASLPDVLAWARELRVGQLLLTHLDKSLDYKTLAAELPDWAAPAHDGLEWAA